MKRVIFRAVVALTVGMGLFASAGSAALITYKVDWTGSGGYTMGGLFSFDTADGADGRIDETELLDLFIYGAQNGSIVAFWRLSTHPYVGAEAFNFNFDPVNELFYVGGNSNFDNGQNWNDDGNTGTSCGVPGFGFNSGSAGQDICVNGQRFGVIFGQSTLTATPVPEPGSMALLGIGLALAFVARKKRH